MSFIDKLKGQIPDAIFNELPSVISKFKIDTPLRLAHFLAQCDHESAHFTRFVENLNYSADGLKKTFPKYFSGKLNESYARKPEAIASRVYGNRMGNGSEASKDGWKFRGRGAIQLTGKNNYVLFDAFVDDNIVANPDLVATKYPLLSAAWFFSVNNINNLADKGTTESVVALVTKKVNGGTIGLSDRVSLFNKYKKLLIG